MKWNNINGDEAVNDEAYNEEDQLILIPGYGRLTLKQAQMKLDDYLQDLAKRSERAKEDPSEYRNIGAIFSQGVVGAVAETLREYYKDR
jgi:hypothetical protein